MVSKAGRNSPVVSRRVFLTRASRAVAALGLPGAALATGRSSGPWVRSVTRQPRFAEHPFGLGVASGHPLDDGFVLWTRLFMPGHRLNPEPVDVHWEVASDERMQHTVSQGVATARSKEAHSLHVELFGLEPNRPYWYRFRAGSEESEVGRTRTAPGLDQSIDRLRFAFASCQHYEQGYFNSYAHFDDEDLDLVVHLGDYIYESSFGVEHVRKHGAPEPVTLDDYRARYATYKGDPDLKRAHASCPWLVTWDDHEVDNDYAGLVSEQLDPEAWFLARRRAAYQAYYEHMPLRRGARPFAGHMRLHADVSFGALASFFVLDDRQYRTQQVCPVAGEGGSNVVASCDERTDPQQTLLGAEQESWLASRFARSHARYNILAQQTLMAQRDRTPGEGRSFWTDGWDGYPIARRRLLDSLTQHQVSNPIAIGGDVHMYWAADLKRDFDDEHAAVIGSELVGTSITSHSNVTDGAIASSLSDNPHLKYGHAAHRGYTVVELTERAALAQFRAVDTVKRANSPVRTLASFAIEDGKPGIVKG